MKVVLIFYFEIPLAPSEIPATLPSQFSLSGQIFLHCAAVTLKGLVEFQNKKTRPLFTILTQQERKFHLDCGLRTFERTCLLKNVPP